MNKLFTPKGLIAQYVAMALGILLLIVALATRAEDIPELKANTAKCLGYEVPYKHYPKPVVDKFQADLYAIYHNDAEWRTAFKQKGNPLNDGLLGPITWSWMQRLCGNFVLGQAVDILAEWPFQLERISGFAEQYPTEMQQIVSPAFTDWWATTPSPCNLNASQILFRGSEQELLALLACFKTPPAAAEPEPALEVKSLDAPENSLFVLRADDFELLAQPDSLRVALLSLVEQRFGSAASASAAATSAVAEQAPAIQAMVLKPLPQLYSTTVQYQLTDEVLSQLLDAGLDQAIFVKLQALSATVFTSETELNSALDKIFSELKTATVTKPSSSREVEHKNADQSIAATNQEVTQALTQELSPEADVSGVMSVQPSALNETSIAVNRYRILQASKVETIQFERAKLKALYMDIRKVNPLMSFPPQLLKIMRSLQDVEFPEGELLHLAIQSVIMKSSNFCKLDKSKTIDVSLVRLSDAERQELTDEIVSFIPALTPSTKTEQVCGSYHFEKLAAEYDLLLRPAINALYVEPMPDYAHQAIQWDGSDCGCVPKQTSTTAYGIYPYWHTTAELKKYDFSTFNRVAYFGLSFNRSGQLQQIKAKNQAQTLVQDPSDEAKAFIRKARTYGSKVDWMIHKDWHNFNSEDPTEMSSLAPMLNSLRLNIVNFLREKLSDPASRFRPLSSLGLTGQPRNGDGVTLYFQHFPTDEKSQQEFEKFFVALKADLKEASDEINTGHSIEQSFYLNLVVDQSNFIDSKGVFNSANLERLLNVQQLFEQNLSLIEMQEKVKSIIVLLLESPYYNSLDEIYAQTNATSRAVIMPLMIDDFSDMQQPANNSLLRDNRFKKLDYINESFGGAAFWPIPRWDQPGYEGFNRYIATIFAPGYAESYWNKYLCVYRWQFISVLNIWLLVALCLVVIVFYLFPYNCQKLPSLLRPLTRPIPLLILLLPPLILWVYLLVADALFPIISTTGVLCMLLWVLSIRAVYLYVKSLNQRKPSRQWALAAQPIVIAKATPRITLNSDLDEDLVEDEMDTSAIKNTPNDKS